METINQLTEEEITLIKEALSEYINRRIGYSNVDDASISFYVEHRYPSFGKEAIKDKMKHVKSRLMLADSLRDKL